MTDDIESLARELFDKFGGTYPLDSIRRDLVNVAGAEMWHEQNRRLAELDHELERLRPAGDEPSVWDTAGPSPIVSVDQVVEQLASEDRAPKVTVVSPAERDAMTSDHIDELRQQEGTE